MPDIHIGGTYPVTNLNTQQTGRFTCNELASYRGFYVLQGTLGQHDIHVVRGIIGVQAKPVAFAFSDHEDRDAILRLDRLADGKPLGIVLDDAEVISIAGRAGVGREGKRLYPILNAATDLRALGSYKTDEEQILFVRKLVDLYCEWRDAGQVLPEWFRWARALIR